MSDAAAELRCPNCGRSFGGVYCPQCGQEAEEPKRPFASLVRDFFGDLFAFDARTWRTLRPLLVQPGFLTIEHFAGRRARYVPPLRLYVFSGIVFFAVMAATGGGPLGFTATTAEGQLVFGFGSVGRGGTITAGYRDETPEPEGTIDRWLAERIERVERDPAAFNAATIEALSYAHFLVLPLFALLMKPFWRRRYYVEHLVFAMHFHAFALLMGAAVIGVYALAGLGPEDPSSTAVVKVSWLALGIYLFVALRRVYGGRRWTTALKLVAFGWLYFMAAVMILLSVAMGTMVRL